MPRFRPMGLGDIFDEAFDLYKKNFLLLLLTAAVVTVPTHLLAPLLAAWLPNEPSLARLLVDGLGEFVPAQVLRDSGPFFGGPAIFAPLYPLASGIQIIALITACAACYLGEQPTLRQAYRLPLRRIVPLALTLLLYALLMTLGMALCYVGILVPWTLLALTGHAFALENLAFGKALRRSSRLVSGFGGRVLGCLLLLIVVTYIVGLGVRLPLKYALDTALNLAPQSHWSDAVQGAAAASDQQRRMAEDISGGLAGLLINPFIFCVLTVMYYDLRVRKEAFDIALLARGLGYPPLAQLGGYLPPVVPQIPAPAPRPAAPPRTAGRFGGRR